MHEQPDTEPSAATVAAGDATVDWCRRCNLARSTVPLWGLNEDGVFRVGHRVHCGCYR